MAAVRGYKLILVMPESMSMERASLLSSYGAQLVLTAAWEGMKGSIKEAESIVAQNPSYFMPDQFSNPANPAMHRKTTGPGNSGSVEWQNRCVCGGRRHRRHDHRLRRGDQRAQSREQESSRSNRPDPRCLSGGEPGPHKIQGIGAGFVPKVLNRTILDRRDHGDR